MQPKLKVLFIINPVSGVNPAKKSVLEQIILETLDPARFEYSCAYTLSAAHALELSSAAVSDGADIIAAVGGDGTVNRVVKGLHGSNAVFAIIPSGSGNGLARHLGIPLDMHKSIALINQMHTRQIDTVSLNHELFVSIAGVGFDALVARKFARSGRRGFFTYFHIALNAYPNYRPRKFRMVIDGTPVKRKALFVSFANSNQFGYNAVIAPNASLEDGLMDVCIVQKAPMISAPYILGLLWRNKINNSGYMEVIKAREVQLTRSRDKVVNLDGEPVKVGKDISIKVNPLSLKIIVP